MIIKLEKESWWKAPLAQNFEQLSHMKGLLPEPYTKIPTPNSLTYKPQQEFREELSKMSRPNKPSVTSTGVFLR